MESSSIDIFSGDVFQAEVQPQRGTWAQSNGCGCRWVVIGRFAPISLAE